MIAVGECLCGGVKFEGNTDLAKTGTTKEQRAYDGSEQNDVPEKQEEGPTNISKSIKFSFFFRIPSNIIVLVKKNSRISSCVI